MKIILNDIYNDEYTVYDFESLTFIQTVGVPCDALSFTFKSDNLPKEIVSVKAYQDGELIFNGFCDNQKSSLTSSGCEVFVYARSSASILVDNEAKPYTYACPSTLELFSVCAQDMGFTNCLPDISSVDEYQISKGTSLFGVINDFVYLLGDSYVYVTPQNELKVFENSEGVVDLGKYKLKSFVHSTNRCALISQINYKNNIYNDYSLHAYSQTANDLQINKIRYQNVSTLPAWQQYSTVAKNLTDTFGDYKIINAVAVGYVPDGLCQRYSYTLGDRTFDDYILTEKKYIITKSGEETRLTLAKQIDLKEIIYVD